MNAKKLKGFQKFDFVIIALTLVCIVFGCVAIGSAVKSYSSGSKFLIIQGGAALIGAVMMIFISFIDLIGKLLYIILRFFLSNFFIS